MIFRFLNLLILLSVLTACGGGGGGESSSTEGVQAAFTLTHQQSMDATGKIPNAGAGAKTFLTREGIKVTLQQAYLVVWSAKLETDCNQINFALPFNLLMTPAMAHTETTPTQLGVPNVINLLEDDTTEILLGTVYPAPASYCGVTVELLKADEDAQHLNDYLINMLNRVLYLEGSYIPLNSNVSVPFVIDVAKAPRPKSLRFDTPVLLSATNSKATVAIVTHYDRWFDAVDFSQLTQDTQMDWILNNITENLSIKK